jgi:hypothetical protein
MAVNDSGSHSVLRGSQGIRDKLPKELWIEFCNGCFEDYFFNLKNNVFLKTIAELLIFISYDR